MDWGLLPHVIPVYCSQFSFRVMRHLRSLALPTLFLGLLFLCPLRASAASTITGRVFADTGSTVGLGSVTVAASLNGATNAASAVADANGYFTLTGINSSSLTGGTVVDPLHRWLGKSQGRDRKPWLRRSMTGMTLIKNTLVIQSGSGGSQMGSPVTSANLVTAKASNSADTDIAAIFTMSSQNMTVVAGKNMEVRQRGVLGLGGTLTTSYLHLSNLSGAVIQGNNAITINSMYTQSGGRLWEAIRGIHYHEWAISYSETVHSSRQMAP